MNGEHVETYQEPASVEVKKKSRKMKDWQDSKILNRYRKRKNFFLPSFENFAMSYYAYQELSFYQVTNLLSFKGGSNFAKVTKRVISNFLE